MKVTPDQLTIISWVLPHTEATKFENRKQTFYPSERWARARWYGEEVNIKFRKHVVITLKEAGFDSVAPMLSPLWSKKRLSGQKVMFLIVMVFPPHGQNGMQLIHRGWVPLGSVMD